MTALLGIESPKSFTQPLEKEVSWERERNLEHSYSSPFSPSYPLLGI
jgi:hypothetical protein